MEAEGFGDRLIALVAELEAADAPDEALGEFVPSRGFGPFATAEKFRPVGRAWRLGVVLIDRSARLYSTGELTRAIQPGRAAVNRSALGERRRALRLAASRTFPKGEVVNFGYSLIDGESIRSGIGPLSILSGELVIRPEPGGVGVTDLERYLRERVALLVGGADQAFS